MTGDQKEIPNSLPENARELSCGNRTTVTTEDAFRVNQAIIERLSTELENINAGLRNGAEKLAETGINQENANVVLSEQESASPYVISPILLDPGLCITAVSREEYRHLIGANLSAQAHLVRAVTSKAPVLGDLINTVEGIPASPLSYPIVKNDSVIGILSVLIGQKEIFEGASLAADPESRILKYIAQTDGTILYSTDPAYPYANVTHATPVLDNSPLADVAGRIASEKSGTVKFFPRIQGYPDYVESEAIWNTTGIYDGVWRVVVICC